MSEFSLKPTENNANDLMVQNDMMEKLTSIGTLHPSNPIGLEHGVKAGNWFDYAPEQDLSNEITVVPIARRYQCRYYNGNGQNAEWKETYRMLDNGSNWLTDEDMLKKDTKYAGNKIEKATEYLLYFPETGVFRTFWAKGKLKTSGALMWEARALNGDFTSLRLKTKVVSVKGKTGVFNWVEFNTEVMGDKVAFPPITARALELFNTLNNQEDEKETPKAR